MTAYTFEVIGDPASQGSKTAFLRGSKPVMVEGQTKAAREKFKSWRAEVADAAREVMEDAGRMVGLDGPAPALDGALRLAVEFRFAMPASRPSRHRIAGRMAKTTAPDLDKAVRLVGDSLTASGMIRDDARIWQIVASKVEVTSWTGATITVEQDG